MTIEDRVRRFIVEELHYDGQPASLSNDLPLIEKNVLDSLGIFQLVSFLESEFGIEVADEELVPEHFGTIGAVARLVQSKNATHGA
jgi:acyl carrier protein